MKSFCYGQLVWKRSENGLKTVWKLCKLYFSSSNQLSTGFHVVVKLLEKLPMEKVEDILSRLCADIDSVKNMAKDQWGCCVLKACLDKASGSCLIVWFKL